MFLPKTPFSSANHFGLAFTSTSIRVMQVDSKGNVLAKSERYFSAPIISSAHVHTQSILAALKEMRQESGIEMKYAAVTLSEKFAFSREHAVPSTSMAEINEAINWQIEKVFPFSKNEVYIDWKLIDQDQTGSKIMVTVIPKLLLDELKSVLQSAEIFPISFEPSASALTRLIPNDQSGELIILELDHTSASASLVLNKVSVLTTTTNFTDQTPPDQVTGQLIGVVQNLQQHLAKNQINTKGLRIILTGDKATDAIAQVLNGQFSLETSLMHVEGIEPSWHLVFIAASQDILPPESGKSINLLPVNLQAYYTAHMDYSLARRVLVYLLSLVVMGVFVGALAYVGSLVTLAAANRQLETAKLESPTVGASGYNLALVNQKAGRLVNLFPKKVSPEQYITELYNVTPEGINLVYINVISGGKAIEVNGIAQNRDALIGYRDALEASNYFARPNIPLAALEDSANKEFSLMIQTKSPEAK
jgi:Tfp pilus assembly protein PilN